MKPVDKKLYHTEPWQDGCMPFRVGEKVGNTNQEPGTATDERQDATVRTLLVMD
jgi:hypothetical protein